MNDPSTKTIWILGSCGGKRDKVKCTIAKHRCSLNYRFAFTPLHADHTIRFSFLVHTRFGQTIEAATIMFSILDLEVNTTIDDSFTWETNIEGTPIFTRIKITRTDSSLMSPETCPVVKFEGDFPITKEAYQKTLSKNVQPTGMPQGEIMMDQFQQMQMMGCQAPCGYPCSPYICLPEYPNVE